MNPTRTLSEDLTYIRDLAEAGRNAPLLGGRFLALWGGLAALGYFSHFLIATGAFGLPPAALGAVWVSFAVLGAGGQFLLSRRARAKPGQSSAGNRVQAVLWTTAGLFLFAYFAGLIIRIQILGTGVEGFYWSVPMVLGLYGIAQFVTGTISSHKALKFAGLAAFAGVIATVFLTGTEYVWLAGSICAFFAVFVPGLILARCEPSVIF